MSGKIMKYTKKRKEKKKEEIIAEQLETIFK